MYITVRLLTNFSKPLTYGVPKQLQSGIDCGVLVQVPLQNRITPAIVISFTTDQCNYSFKVRNIDSIFPFPKDPCYKKFIETLSLFHQIESLDFYKRLKSFLFQKEVAQKVEQESEKKEQEKIVLTDEQKKACDAILPDIIDAQYKVTVLHGVTGSGKTEVYKKLFFEATSQGKTALFLLPEVSLAMQFEKILSSQMQDVAIFGFHSATTVKQKRLLWQALLKNQPAIIVGVHLPVLLPVANLGLIVVDEEHDSGYQEKKHPKIHSRNAAILKAQSAGIPVVLGSATPSISSLWNVKKKGWRLQQLKNRFSGQFPTVQVVSISDKKERKNFWISTELYNAIKQQLAKKEQTIVFINRRGFSFFVQCKSCSFIFSCNNCSVSLTLHDNQGLVCHYCGFNQMMQSACSDCGGKEFLKKGIGTQQVVSILNKIFPQAIIERADLDTTSKKRAWQETVEDFQQQKIDILVGTQSITKGYHFPKVTLVGVLWADLNLHFPIYNAAETTLQQLIQVAGRAGRQSPESKVIVQTMTHHDIFDFVSEKDYLKFYDSEVKKREEVGYPPVKHIAEIEIRNENQNQVESDADLCVDRLMDIAGEEILVLGPVPAVVYRVKKTFSQKIFLKSMNRKNMIHAFEKLEKSDMKSSIFFTIDPVN